MDSGWWYELQSYKLRAGRGACCRHKKWGYFPKDYTFNVYQWNWQNRDGIYLSNADKGGYQMSNCEAYDWYKKAGGADNGGTIPNPGSPRSVPRNMAGQMDTTSFWGNGNSWFQWVHSGNALPNPAWYETEKTTEPWKMYQQSHRTTSPNSWTWYGANTQDTRGLSALAVYRNDNWIKSQQHLGSGRNQNHYRFYPKRRCSAFTQNDIKLKNGGRTNRIQEVTVTKDWSFEEAINPNVKEERYTYESQCNINRAGESSNWRWLVYGPIGYNPTDSIGSKKLAIGEWNVHIRSLGHLNARSGFYGHFNAGDGNSNVEVGRHRGAGKHVTVDDTVPEQLGLNSDGNFENQWTNMINLVFNVGKENPAPTGVAVKCDECRGFYEEDSLRQFIGTLITTDPEPTCGEFTYELDSKSVADGFSIDENGVLFLQRDHDREDPNQGTFIDARIKTTDTVREECGITGSVKSGWFNVRVDVLNVPEPPTDTSIRMKGSQSIVDRSWVYNVATNGQISKVTFTDWLDTYNGGRLRESNSDSLDNPVPWTTSKNILVATLGALGDPDGAQNLDGTPAKYEFKCLSGSNTWVNKQTSSSGRCGGPRGNTFYVQGNGVYLASSNKNDLNYETAFGSTTAAHTQLSKDMYHNRKKAHGNGGADWKGPYYDLSVKSFEPSGVVQKMVSNLRIYLKNVNEPPSKVTFTMDPQKWSIDDDGADILQPSPEGFIETTENGARVGYFLASDPDYEEMGMHECYYQDQMKISLQNQESFPYFVIRWSEDGDTPREGALTGKAIFGRTIEKGPKKGQLGFIKDKTGTEVDYPAGYQPRECSYSVVDENGNTVNVRKGRWELWSTLVPTDFEEAPGPVYNMVVEVRDQNGLPRSPPGTAVPEVISQKFTVVLTDLPELPKLAAFAHYEIREDALTGSSVGDIKKALSEANPKTLQFRLNGGHNYKLPGGFEGQAFTIDACGGEIAYKLGAEFSSKFLYNMEVLVSLRIAAPPIIVDGKIVVTGSTSMFVHVEIIDGETEPLFNPEGTSGLIGQIQESSVCAAKGGRIPGCPCDVNKNGDDGQCMDKQNGCQNGVCQIPTLPIGVYDPDGPHDLSLEVSVSGNKNKEGKIAFEVSPYRGLSRFSPEGGLINPSAMTFGKDVKDNHFIHPKTTVGHIDSFNEITNTDSFTIDLEELSMITGVVIMAAPVLTSATTREVYPVSDLNAKGVINHYNFVKYDENAIFGPAPNYKACQVQCDICNLNECKDGRCDLHNWEKDPLCRCKSWTFNENDKICGLTKIHHRTSNAVLRENGFTSGYASGKWNSAAAVDRHVPIGDKIDAFTVEYKDKSGQTKTIQNFVKMNSGSEEYSGNKIFKGNKWRGQERVYRYFDVAVWATEITIRISLPVKSQRGFRVAAIQAPKLQLHCINNVCSKLDAETGGEYTLTILAKDPSKPKISTQGKLTVLIGDVNEAPDVMVSAVPVSITELGQIQVGVNMVEFEHSIVTDDPEGDDATVQMYSQSPGSFFKIVAGTCHNTHNNEIYVGRKRLPCCKEFPQ